MAFPTFSKPGVATVVEFTTGIVSPVTIEIATNQSWQMSDAGVPYVYRWGPVVEMWIFGAANITVDTYQDLLMFFNDPGVNWKEQPFLYTDEQSVAWSTQLADDRLQVQRRAIGTYDLALRLLHRTDLEV